MTKRSKPARPVIRRSPHRNVGVITIPWLQQEPIEWESQLERWCIYSLIALWVVTEILHQPYKIPIPSEGKENYYIPDFAITLNDGSRIVIEVKPARFIAKNEARFKFAQAWLRERGIHFVLLTEVQLRHRAWKHIVPMFLRYARWDVAPALIESVKQRLQDAGGEANFGSLWDGSDPNTKIAAYFLIGRREIFCDPRSWDDDATRISLIHKSEYQLNEKGDENGSQDNQCASDLFLQWFGIESWGAYPSISKAD